MFIRRRTEGTSRVNARLPNLLTGRLSARLMRFPRAIRASYVGDRMLEKRDDFYRGYSIQVERVRNTLYAFVWPPGSRIEWGREATTATFAEKRAVLLSRVHDRIDLDIADSSKVGRIDPKVIEPKIVREQGRAKDGPRKIQITV
jgi:hypothetical protein